MPQDESGQTVHYVADEESIEFKDMIGPIVRVAIIVAVIGAIVFLLFRAFLA
jgi:hypothetical protein